METALPLTAQAAGSGQVSMADPDFQPSMTLLNFTGDITITWDAQNRARMIEIVRKKMAEGYSFFTTKAGSTARVTRRTRVTEKNLNGIDGLTLSDREFNRLVTDLDDRDVAELVSTGGADLAKRTGVNTGRTAITRLNSAEEVVDTHSVGLRRIVGG